MPKISIIIPVYNTAGFLSVCLNSLLNLEEKNFEVFLVDDGSSDQSGKICDMYADKDQRFKVVHQENRGVSAARNRVLNNISGEWVCFIDSDDEVSNDYLTISSKEENYDVIVRSSRIQDEKGNIISRNSIRKACPIYNSDVKRYIVTKMRNPLWDKIFKRQCIGNLKFNEKFCIEEDFLFGLSVMIGCSSIILSPVGEYILHTHSDSTMGTILKNPVKFMDTKVQVLDELFNVYGDGKDMGFLMSLIFYRYLPYFSNKSYMFKLTSSQKRKLKWMLSIYKSDKLVYLTFYQRVCVFIRIVLAWLYILFKP